MSELLGLTPSQTVGPFLHIALPWPDGPYAAPPDGPDAIVITGVLYDGTGDPVPDALVESWQADPAGRFDHPDDPRGAARAPGEFRGFARCPTDETGRYRIVTVKPGRLPTPGGRFEAPHLNLSIFARGLLNRVVTRVYFDDEDNSADPLLSALPERDRSTTLIAVRQAGGYRFDIHLQGPQETVFFEV